LCVNEATETPITQRGKATGRLAKKPKKHYPWGAARRSLAGKPAISG